MFIFDKTYAIKLLGVVPRLNARIFQDDVVGTLIVLEYPEILHRHTYI